MPSRNQARLSKSFEILSCTVKEPQFSYAHLELFTDDPQPPRLDILQVKAYCTAALRQFLGLTGQAMPIDIIKVEGNQCWLRVPRQDLGRFAAAITAWKGTSDGGVRCLFRLQQCSDWLGVMVGSDGQDRLWGP